MSRAVTGDFDCSSSVSGIIKDLGWMFLSILIFKCLNSLALNYLSSYLHYVSETQSYDTCAATFKHSFQYSGPTLWNSLPSHYRI